ncbi:MAG: hypothetical protein K0Q59_4275, partial [Paenibacillus sp.]|nr:hypothetical protein [Paenibacillus sp.]
MTSDNRIYDEDQGYVRVSLFVGLENFLSNLKEFFSKKRM